MEKEPLFDSARFKVMLAAVLVEVGLFFADAYVVDIDPSALQAIALGIAGVVSAFIWGRTKRNSAEVETLTEADWKAYLDSGLAERDFKVVGE